jgi:acetyl esterase/lipase
VSAAFTQDPTMPASGRYATPIYSSGQITRTSNLRYRSAVNHLGQTVDLSLDIWTPPAGPTATRPLVVLFHGGGFVGGSRGDFAAGAVDLAKLGFVAASVSYRLRPAGAPLLAVAGDAIDDGMESVRWLKANASTFGIDPTRIAALGTSAGGVIALGLALVDDQTPGGPLAGFSPSVSAAVSTGGHLTPGLSVLDLREEQPPVWMINYEVDPTLGDAPEAFKTCAAVRASGNTCDFTEVPGEGHQSWITPGGPIWTSGSGPFLWHHLRLA